MTKLLYIRRCFKLAFAGPWGIADGLAGFFAFMGSALDKAFPQLEPVILYLAWMVPFGLFVALGVWRITIAQFWLYKELEQEKEKLQKTRSMLLARRALEFQGKG